MAFNAFTTKSVLTRFGILGINLDNLEQLYSPLLTGLGSMSNARFFLIQRGMTAELADSLALRYIQHLERSKEIHSIMDFFDCARSGDALNALQRSPLSDVHLNYQTWTDYQQ